MTREEWIERGKTLLEGVFSHVGSLEEPIRLPRREYGVTYPRGKKDRKGERAAYTETLVRTFCLASVLIREEPGLVLCGVPVRAYYRKWLLRLCAEKGREEDRFRAGYYGESGSGLYQQTVECGLLTVALWISEDVLWKTYSPEEKDRIAGFIESYACGSTVMQNWRICNMLCLAFLYREGRGCDRALMKRYAQGIRTDAVPGGWYRDGKAFDYYTAWSYQIFLPVWNLWYGRREEPELAAFFEGRLKEMLKTYPAFFDRDGKMFLWGRSGIYRCAAAAPFIGGLLLDAVKPGTARRVLEGALRQFTEREIMGDDGVLPLGFYGAFSPAVQSYSCVASPYWMSMIFWCLLFPQGHPL